MNESITTKLNNSIIVLFFCASITLTLILGIVEEDASLSTREKRKLSEMPAMPVSAQEINDFPKLFESYYSDHFGLRSWYTKHYKQIKYRLGDSPSEDVTIGKNDWLFLGSSKKSEKKYLDPIGDFQNKNLFTQGELSRFAQYINGLHAWLRAKGIEYVFVIAPNKHTIYHDQMPDYISKVSNKSAADQLLEHLSDNTDITIVDLRPALLAAKDEEQLYFKTDTHWNHYGANIAQHEIMIAIEQLFPGMLQPELVELKPISSEGGDLVDMMGLDNFVDQDAQPVFHNACTPRMQEYRKDGRHNYKFTCPDQKLKALIFRDSFFSLLIPYFSRKFETSTVLYTKLQYSALKQHMELDPPNVVIEEWVERTLPYVPKSVSEFNTALFKESFEASNDVIFNNQWHQLKYRDLLKETPKESNGTVQLTSTSPRPIINFPALKIDSAREHIIYLRVNSSAQSTMQLYYSIKNFTGYAFSENNSIRVDIHEGENEIYLPFSDPNLGRYLRLDPIRTKGKLTIEKLLIKTI